MGNIFGRGVDVSSNSDEKGWEKDTSETDVSYAENLALKKGELSNEPGVSRYAMGVEVLALIMQSFLSEALTSTVSRIHYRAKLSELLRRRPIRTSILPSKSKQSGYLSQSTWDTLTSAWLRIGSKPSNRFYAQLMQGTQSTRQ